MNDQPIPAEFDDDQLARILALREARELLTTTKSSGMFGQTVRTPDAGSLIVLSEYIIWGDDEEGDDEGGVPEAGDEGQVLAWIDEPATIEFSGEPAHLAVATDDEGTLAMAKPDEPHELTDAEFHEAEHLGSKMTHGGEDTRPLGREGDPEHEAIVQPTGRRFGELRSQPVIGGTIDLDGIVRTVGPAADALRRADVVVGGLGTEETPFITEPRTVLP